MRMSQSLMARWKAERLGEALPEIRLQWRLHELVQAPFVQRGGGLVLEPLVANATGREAFQDATGYEAFINKIHVDDLVDEAGIEEHDRLRILLQQGVKAAMVLAERLKAEGSFRVLLSLDADLPSITLRFFRRREGEHWAGEDPDAFRLEEVLMIDTERSP
jgi:hypothetical protein